MKPKETVTKYWQAWTEHNLNNLLSLLSPEFISRSSLSQGRPASKDLVAKGFKMFMQALPDLKEEIFSIIAEDDKVACQIVESATFTGSMELPTGELRPTNQSYKIAVASFFRVNTQGIIIKQWSYWDTALWAQQIGIDPKLFVPKS